MKLTVYVEKVGPRNDIKFRVVRVRNGTEPGVGTVLEKSEVDRLVTDGTEVIVDLPRKRD